MWCGSQKKCGRSLARILTFPRSRIRTRIIKGTGASSHTRRLCDLPREIAAEVLGRLVPYALGSSPASHSSVPSLANSTPPVTPPNYEDGSAKIVSPPYHHVRARKSSPRYQCVPRCKPQWIPSPPRSRKRLLASTPLPLSRTPSMRSSVRACSRTGCSFIPFVVCPPPPTTNHPGFLFYLRAQAA